MDYEKEIKQKRKEINELIKKQVDLLVKEYPDIAGKFYIMCRKTHSSL